MDAVRLLLLVLLTTYVLNGTQYAIYCKQVETWPYLMSLTNCRLKVQGEQKYATTGQNGAPLVGVKFEVGTMMSGEYVLQRVKW